jgi:excisionase family DNA binding protein
MDNESPLTSILDARKNSQLSTTDAANYLGITTGTLNVWRCTKRYQIPYIKVGRLVKYRRSDLDTWLESRTIG